MFFADLLFPPLCFGCGRLGSSLCLSCEKKLDRTEPLCFYCRKPSAYGLTHPYCKKKKGVDGFISLYKYHGVFQRVIKKIKYSLISYSAREIFSIMLFSAVQPIAFYRKTFGEISLQCVPLFEAREKQRGFNQSALLSQSLSRFFSMRQTDSVVRAHMKSPQAEIFSWRKRRANIKNVFIMKKNSTPPRETMIVDDVVTSGATVGEVALLLKEHSAHRVFVFSLACG